MSVAQASRAIRVHDLPWRGFGGMPLPTRRTTLAIVTSSTIATATSESSILPRVTDRDTSRNPVTFPTTCIRPTIPLAMPTCGSATRSGTYPWNGPRAMLVLTASSSMKAASMRTELPMAIPIRNTTSSSDPKTMYGLRRPQRETV